MNPQKKPMIRDGCMRISVLLVGNFYLLESTLPKVGHSLVLRIVSLLVYIRLYRKHSELQSLIVPYVLIAIPFTVLLLQWSWHQFSYRTESYIIIGSIVSSFCQVTIFFTFDRNLL